MDLGLSLWTLNGFGPLPIFSLLEAHMLYFFPRFQSFTFFLGLWYNIVIFWTSTHLNKCKNYYMIKH